MNSNVDIKAFIYSVRFSASPVKFPSCIVKKERKHIKLEKPHFLKEKNRISVALILCCENSSRSSMLSTCEN